MAKNTFDLNQSLRAAQRSVVEGRLPEAKGVAERILLKFPNNSAAQLILAQIANAEGDLALAISHLQKSLQIDRKNSAATDIYIDVLNRLLQSKQFEVLQEASLWLTGFYPGNGLAWDFLGISYIQTGQFKAAYEAEKKALALLPNNAHVYCNLGNVLIAQEKFAEAIEVLRKSVDLDPTGASAHNNLGNAYRHIGKLPEAIQCFERVLELAPDLAYVHNNLAIAYFANSQAELALRSCRKALDLQPDLVEIYPTIVDILRSTGRLNEAIKTCEQAQVHCEQLPHFWGAYGNALRDAAHVNAAIDAYAKAIALTTDTESPYCKLMYTNLLFCLNYQPDMDGELIFGAYKEFDQRFCVQFRQQWRAFQNSREPGKRLKVGYLSHVFYNQVCRYFLIPLMERHNHQEVEVFVYANNTTTDEFTEQYKACADHWINTNDLTDDGLADRIRQDGIDILVDVAGHTSGNRLAVFARKPAPVSLHWLEYGYTTGLSSIDYYLTDQIVAAGNPQNLFSEKLWPMSRASYSYRPPVSPPLSSLPCLKDGIVTFGSLSRSIRINHRVVRVWAAILDAMPNSRLIINSGDFRDPEIQEEMASRFVKLGIDRSRLKIFYSSPSFDALNEIDIGLDCFPHNSGTTLVESLYMGVPFITLFDRASVGRLGASILAAAGHPEWIAESEMEYAQKAIMLAHDIEGLTRIRATLRSDMERSPIMDEAGFARAIEQAYRQMWQKFCEENPV